MAQLMMFLTKMIKCSRIKSIRRQQRWWVRGHDSPLCYILSPLCGICIYLKFSRPIWTTPRPLAGREAQRT